MNFSGLWTPTWPNLAIWSISEAYLKQLWSTCSGIGFRDLKGAKSCQVPRLEFAAHTGEIAELNDNRPRWNSSYKYEQTAANSTVAIGGKSAEEETNITERELQDQCGLPLVWTKVSTEGVRVWEVLLQNYTASVLCMPCLYSALCIFHL